ncbi:MAG: hypothetical protein EYC68_11075 [Chloroflexota bacterium]|nr:MAG: hypothetical protein EYC68_11075 [Chloroflexota bacterium]
MTQVLVWTLWLVAIEVLAKLPVAMEALRELFPSRDLTQLQELLGLKMSRRVRLWAEVRHTRTEMQGQRKTKTEIVAA